MSPRFRPTDAFVDESIRGQRYLMGCALVEARFLASVRAAIVGLADRAKRLHFHQELDRTRRTVLKSFASMPVRVELVSCTRGHGVTEFQARAVCLTEIVLQLQDRSISRLTIESRRDDRDDQRTIAVARRSAPTLVFDHRDGRVEPLLWFADAVTWAFGAGGRCLPLVEPLVDRVVELRP
jgi:hypothetical protein